MLLLRNEDASRQVHTAKNVFPEYTFSIICLKHIFLKSRQEDTIQKKKKMLYDHKKETEKSTNLTQGSVERRRKNKCHYL